MKVKLIFPLAGGKWQFLYIIKLQRGLRTWKHGYILCRHCPVFRCSECFRQPRDCFTIIVNTLRKQDLVKQDGSMPPLEQQCVHLPSSGEVHLLVQGLLHICALKTSSLT